MHVCAPSTAPQNISGQPPTIGLDAECRARAHGVVRHAASTRTIGGTIPEGRARRTLSHDTVDACGDVTITTPSSGCGTSATS